MTNRRTQNFLLLEVGDQVLLLARLGDVQQQTVHYVADDEARSAANHLLIHAEHAGKVETNQTLHASPRFRRGHYRDRVTSQLRVAA